MGEGFLGPVLCPTCPTCRAEPIMIFGGGTQAFCPTVDGSCSTFCWNMLASLDDNLMDASFIGPIEMTEGSDGRDRP